MMLIVSKGYVFKDVQEISPFLEDCETGPSVMWAKTQGRTHLNG